MIRKVLIAHDDEEMLFTLQQGLEKHHEIFSVVTASDGLEAMEVLKKQTISLVVSDLKTPQTGGMTLPGHVMEYYPEIPVIVIAAHSDSDMERLAGEGGAVEILEKPFSAEDLARKIMESLKKESEGGTLHDVASSGMFLQLIEMEQRTCTIRLAEKSAGKQGILFFLEGILVEARVNGLSGEEAAYEIFSWDEVTLSIQNACAYKQRKIQKDLQAVLMDAMRVKDEISHAETRDVSPDASAEDDSGTPDGTGQEIASNIEQLGAAIEKELGGKPGIEDIYKDDSWDGLVEEMTRIGTLLGIGAFKVGYVDVGEDRDHILVPGKETAVVTVNSKCPRDRIIQILSG